MCLSSKIALTQSLLLLVCLDVKKNVPNISMIDVKIVKIVKILKIEIVATMRDCHVSLDIGHPNISPTLIIDPMVN